MARVVALDDEVGESGLIEQGRVLVRRSARGHQALLEVGRYDHEAQPEGREERLAEAGDIDHPPVDVQAVQTRDGASPVPELAVVVVLEDPGARPARPPEE